MLTETNNFAVCISLLNQLISDFHQQGAENTARPLSPTGPSQRSKKSFHSPVHPYARSPDQTSSWKQKFNQSDTAQFKPTTENILSGPTSVKIEPIDCSDRSLEKDEDSDRQADIYHTQVALNSGHETNEVSVKEEPTSEDELEITGYELGSQTNWDTRPSTLGENVIDNTSK